MIPTDKQRLCVVVQRLAGTCSNPLSASTPATFTIVDVDGSGGAAAVAFGVTVDGVRSVSFAVAGKPVTVPARGNWFVYRAPASASAGDFSPATVAFADGSIAAIR